jgi:hypothetical protein
VASDEWRVARKDETVAGGEGVARSEITSPVSWTSGEGGQASALVPPQDKGAQIRPAQVANYDSQIAEFRSPIAPFLIDIWRLEIAVTHSKHSVGARSNRQWRDSPQIGVFAAASASMVAPNDRVKDSER